MTDQEQPSIRERLGLETSVFVRLTEDELIVVMAALQLPRIAGYAIPEQVSQAALNAARNTLRAKGAAVLEPDGRLVVDETVGALVVAMARWARLLSIKLKFAGDAIEQNWIALGSLGPVLHTIPEPGIHQFQTLPDSISMMLAVSGLMRMLLSETAVPGKDEFHVDPQLIADADALGASQGAQELYKQLVAAGLPETFAAAAAGPTVNCSVSVIWPTTGEPNKDGIIEFTERGFWLWGVPDNKGYWMLTPEWDARKVRVTPVNSQQVINVIGDYLVEDVRTAS